MLPIAFTVLSAVISWAIYRDRQRISQLGIMISNMGFVGIPLVQTVIGEEYVFYISVCIAAQVPLTWSYGLWLVTQDKSTVSPKKILTNPAVISVAVGVVLFLFSLELGGVIKVAVDDMAGLNTGLAMIVLGTYLVQTDIRGVIRNPNLYLSNLVRLIIIPLITIAVLMFLPLPTPVKLVILIGFAAPCARSRPSCLRCSAATTATAPAWCRLRRCSRLSPCPSCSGWGSCCSSLGNPSGRPEL